MNIWTEKLEKSHLPELRRWHGRRDGALTPNDLPEDAERLPQWFEAGRTEAGRLDCLVLAYETPVGLAGLRQCGAEPGTAELSLLLGEVNYNLLRTATYAALRMLDRAFLDLGFERAVARVDARHAWFADTLEQMGFSREAERDGLILLRAEKSAFLSRKYLF